MGKLGVPYERVVYGYGQGANPAEAGGTGYDASGGPVALTGKKVLPVLAGDGVPAPAGMRGLPESLEICSCARLLARCALRLPRADRDRTSPLGPARGARLACAASPPRAAAARPRALALASAPLRARYVAACAPPGSRVAPATGRADVDRWRAAFKEPMTLLARPRLPQMPVADWSDARDGAYATWKYTTNFQFDYERARARTAELLPAASAALRDLEALLRGVDADGVPCLNAWGFSMDDVLLLPDLRQLSCVAGVEWPTRVRAYLDGACAKAECKAYDEHAQP